MVGIATLRFRAYYVNSLNYLFFGALLQKLQSEGIAGDDVIYKRKRCGGSKAWFVNQADATVSIFDNSSFIRCSACHKSYDSCIRSQISGPFPANFPILSAISVVIG